ncbi:MAG: hypothetical protein KAJ78_07950, partial [Acidobacteria bacterium]|nr:hypothetical protein [Acidobacteriota bacterium]
MRRCFVVSLITMLMGTAGVFAAQQAPTFLTGPSEGHPLDIVLVYVEANRAALDLTPEDLVGLRVEQYRSEGTGITH